ncbi:MAG: hypothetical protein JO180_08475 [Gemmatirosa sp.]|nr:hypothetical protein [Gemmatirosa sp.]
MAEFLLVVAIPLAWALWELVSLARHRPDADASAPPPDEPDPGREPGEPR